MSIDDRCPAGLDWDSGNDAQVAYETAGGTAADPGFVNSLDPNWDGVACEELMAY